MGLLEPENFAKGPGWYPDPEAPDLERWWDGRSWSDEDFRPIPEASEFERRLAGYRDLSPSSPTNVIAVSALVCAIAAFLLAVAGVVLDRLWASTGASVVGDAMLVVLSLGAIVFGLWSIVYGVLGVRNSVRHRGAKRGFAVASLVVAVVAVGAAIVPMLSAVARLLAAVVA